MNEKLTAIKNKVSQKLRHFRSELFFLRADVLLGKGASKGRVQKFDDEFYQQTSKVYFNCLPISMHLKYLRPTSGPGKCYDRSLYMFFCFDDALLVRGDQKTLALKYGTANAGHGWIERGDWVYDPTFLLRFQKDWYYKMFGVSNVYKCSHAEYVAIPENKKIYDQVRNTTLQDYQPHGKYRLDLLTSIPLVKGIAEMSGNLEFQQALDQHLASVQYDEAEISRKLTGQNNKKIFANYCLQRVTGADK